MRGNAEHSLVGWEPAGWGFWLRWTLISAIGFALSFVVGTLLSMLWGALLTVLGYDVTIAKKRVARLIKRMTDQKPR